MEEVKIDFWTQKEIDWYKSVDENISIWEVPYYTDVFSPWETKEQLRVWFEVSSPKIMSWTIDTSTATLADRVYTLAVPNPDWKIFSIWIDWMEKTFKIGFFWNTPLAYSTLETELRAWLWTDYTVTYVSWTNYTISKYDWSAISKTSPNLVRTITLTWFDSISVVDVIVDWVTVSLNWATHSWSASTAITYLKSQLSTSLYYMNDDSNVLTIARKDWAIPTISKTQYNLYTYSINYSYSDTPNVWQFWDYTDTTINGVVYRTTWTWTRAFYWDEIIRNLGWFVNTIWTWMSTTSTTALKRW